MTTRWGSGPNRVLLIHGVLSSGPSWWRVAADFVDRGYEVWAPDLRGHGSTPAGETMRLDDYRDDLLALAPSWDLVLGHSLGGALALAALAVTPGWTDRLVLEDPLLILDDAEAARLDLREAVTEPIDDEATISARHPRWHPRDVEIEARSFRQCGADTVDRSLRDTGAFDLRPHFDALRVPTLLLGADPTLGATLPPELGGAIAAGYPDVRFEVVTGGSHSMHRDAYDEFWAILDQFLAATGG